MCIRYDPATHEVLQYSFEKQMWVVEQPAVERKSKSAFPGDLGRIIRWQEGGEPTTDEAQWGLQPFWAKKGDGKPNLAWGRINAYNARSETITEKPTFRTPFQKR